MFKLRIVLGISIILNILLVLFLYNIFQDNNKLKQAIINQYALQQEDVYEELQRAIENRDNKDEYVRALASANAMIYSNEALTKSDTEANIGAYVGFPVALNTINSSYFSRAVGYSLISRALDEPSDETHKKLETYTSYISQLVNKLDYKNNIEGKNLRVQQNNLEEASKLIEQFDLE